MQKKYTLLRINSIKNSKEHHSRDDSQRLVYFLVFCFNELKHKMLVFLAVIFPTFLSFIKKKSVNVLTVPRTQRSLLDFSTLNKTCKYFRNIYFFFNSFLFYLESPIFKSYYLRWLWRSNLLILICVQVLEMSKFFFFKDRFCFNIQN